MNGQANKDGEHQHWREKVLRLAGVPKGDFYRLTKEVTDTDKSHAPEKGCSGIEHKET